MTGALLGQILGGIWSYHFRPGPTTSLLIPPPSSCLPLQVSRSTRHDTLQKNTRPRRQAPFWAKISERGLDPPPFSLHPSPPFPPSSIDRYLLPAGPTAANPAPFPLLLPSLSLFLFRADYPSCSPGGTTVHRHVTHFLA